MTPDTQPSSDVRGTARSQTEADRSAPLAVVDRLIAILDRENAALAAGNFDALAPLLPEKRSACREWEEAALALGAGAAAADGTRRVRRRALDDAIARLQRASGENEARLGAVLAAHRRVVDVIVGALQARDAPTSGYGRDGGLASRPSSSTAPRAVGFDHAT